MKNHRVHRSVQKEAVLAWLLANGASRFSAIQRGVGGLSPSLGRSLRGMTAQGFVVRRDDGTWLITDAGRLELKRATEAARAEVLRAAERYAVCTGRTVRQVS